MESKKYTTDPGDRILLQTQMATTLKNSLLFAQSSVENPEILAMLRNEVAACLSIIDAGLTPPIKDVNDADTDGIPVIRAFITSVNWGKSPEVRTLFTALVKAGFIDVDGPMSVPDFQLSAYRRGSLPLEAAIITGNHSALDALLENGADINKVPSPASSTFSGSNKSQVNIFSFIDIYRSIQDDGIVFAAKIKEAIMRRQIGLVMNDTEAALAAAPSERRRSMGV